MIFKFIYVYSQADHTIIYKHWKNNKISILSVYVDDIILTSDDETSLANLKKKLACEFQIKDQRLVN